MDTCSLQKVWPYKGEITVQYLFSLEVKFLQLWFFANCTIFYHIHLTVSVSVFTLSKPIRTTIVLIDYPQCIVMIDYPQCIVKIDYLQCIVMIGYPQCFCTSDCLLYTMKVLLFVGNYFRWSSLFTKPPKIFDLQIFYQIFYMQCLKPCIQHPTYINAFFRNQKTSA